MQQRHRQTTQMTDDRRRLMPQAERNVATFGLHISLSLSRFLSFNVCFIRFYTVNFVLPCSSQCHLYDYILIYDDQFHTLEYSGEFICCFDQWCSFKRVVNCRVIYCSRLTLDTGAPC